MLRSTGLAVVFSLAFPCFVSADAERRLFVYGDSLAIGTKPYLRDSLADWRIKTDADYSRKTRTAPSALRARGDKLEPILHFSLGTVDDPERPERFRRRVRRTLRIAGRDRCVVWANIYRPLRRPDGWVVNGWRRFNRVLAEEADRRLNLLVVDWASMVEQHTEWLSPVDGTHVSKRGYRARARAVARAVRDCYELTPS